MGRSDAGLPDVQLLHLRKWYYERHGRKGKKPTNIPKLNQPELNQTNVFLFPLLR